jgi:diguanylate cyclase (GGDEF)-like protein
MMKTPRAKVLLVPVRPELAALGEALSEAGYAVTTAKGAEQAAAYAISLDLQAVILDLAGESKTLVLDGAGFSKTAGSALPLLEAVLQSRSSPAVLCYGEDIPVEMAVAVMRAGAYDCLFGPVDAAALLNSLRRALEERSQLQELVSLRKVVEVFSSLRSLESTYEKVRHSIAELFNAQSCSLSLLDADRGEIVAQSPQYGLQANSVPSHRFRLSESRISKLILERGEPYLANSVSADPLFEPATDAKGLNSLLAVAMRRPAGPTGFIYLANRPGGFSRLDAELLTIIGEQVAVALENAHSFDDAYRASITDPLTDLYNRRFFDARLRQEYSRVRRTGKTLGLMFVDLDGFKQINDTFGHAAGNLVLTQVARIIRQNCRSADVAARWGGDEFTVLLTESEPASLEVIARRVRDSIQTTNWGPVGEITATIGLAVMPQDAATLEGLLQAADEAMYLAKKRGRNAYALASEVQQAGAAVQSS